MPLPTKATVSRPLAEGYGALIEHGPNPGDSLYLRLAVAPSRQLQLATVEPREGGALDLAENPEDMRSESGQPFSRSDFSGGEGLRHAHRRDGTSQDFARYFDSKGIDVDVSEAAGNSLPLKLAHTMSVIRSGVQIPVRTGGKLFVIDSDGNGVDVSSNPTASTPSWSNEDPHAGEGTASVSFLAEIRDEVYAAISNNGVHKRDTGGTWTHFSDLEPTVIWSVKQRLVGYIGTGQDLYEVRSGANSVLLHSLDALSAWTDVVDAGPVILAAATDGNIYAFAEEAGDLVLQWQTSFEGGEIPEALAYRAGLVFIATEQDTTGTGNIGRLYRAVVVGNQLRERQLLRRWGSSDGSVPGNLGRRGFHTSRDSVFLPVFDSFTEMHVWRYHLATGGLTRHLVIPAGNSFQGITEFDDRLFVAVSGDGLYREDTTYESSGYLISPLADFYNAGKKAWMGGRLQTGNLPAGTQVDLYYSTDPEAIDDPDHASWTLLITADPNNPGESVETPISGVESRFLLGKLELSPDGTNESTPEALAFAFRGVAATTEEDYVIPLNISDRLEVPNRKAVSIPGVGDAVYEQLRSLIGSAVTVTLLRPDEQIIGTLRNLSTPIIGQPERGTPTLYAQLTVRGARQ